MTNEELAVAIQAGEKDRLPELWDQVKDFISMQAGKRAFSLNGYGGVTEEDLFQSGYFALLMAVESFDPDAGMSFIGWLAFALRNTFAETAGYKKGKRDPLNSAASLDKPLDSEDGGTATLADLQEDVGATQDFEDTEKKIWCEQLHGALETALEKLSEEDQAAIQARYYQGYTLKETAGAMGVTAEAIRTRIQRAITLLRRNRNLQQFVERRTSYYSHVGIKSFQSTNTSAVERIVLDRERLADQWISDWMENAT